MKYLNINVTEEDIDRKPDRVRLYDGESSKSIEYEPIRPKGEWIKVENESGSDVICSNCKDYMVVHKTKYCPNCGAEMKGTI